MSAPLIHLRNQLVSQLIEINPEAYEEDRSFYEGDDKQELPLQIEILREVIDIETKKKALLAKRAIINRSDVDPDFIFDIDFQPNIAKPKPKRPHFPKEQYEATRNNFKNALDEIKAKVPLADSIKPYHEKMWEQENNELIQYLADHTIHFEEK